MNNKPAEQKPNNTHKGSHAGVDTTRTKSKATARKALLITGIVLLLIAVAAATFLIVSQISLQKTQEENAQAATAVSVEHTAVNTVENPVDFAQLQQENPDIYSWLYIPDTNINYPVLQSPDDDNYYLQHNKDNDQAIEGALYTQRLNKLDYSDPVTLIYGHNISQPEMMFHQLHLFEDADFFNEHATFYIYTPGHILTYEIIAAYEYDNRHILNAFDFTNTQVRSEYYDSVLHPDSLVANVRENATLSTDDRIVQLSTCVESGNSASRYIVTGKLINDQATQ